MTLYFINILLRKIKLINNKTFAIITIAVSIYQLLRCIFIIYGASEILLLDMLYFVKYLAHITIVPYFYNYYELLKGGN